MILTYKYRIKDRSARKTLSRYAWAVNQVWNWCVSQQKDTQARYRAGGPVRKWLDQYAFARACNGVGKDLGIPQKTVQMVCRQFARNRDDMRGAPRYRSSFGRKRARGWIPFSSQARSLDGNCIKYCQKKFRFFGAKRRPLPDLVKGGAFFEDNLGRWYVYFEVDVPARAPSPAAAAVGIDLGLKSLLTLSDGHKVECPRFFRASEQKLAAAQRARRSERVRRIHAGIKNRRSDFAHKITSLLASEYSIIAVGNVNARKLAKGRLGKSIYDAGWSMVRTYLAYKAHVFVSVDEKFTTQTCSCCGDVSSSERPRGIAGLSKREWGCSNCGETHDRDVNAARNILIRAQSALRLAGESREAALLRPTG